MTDPATILIITFGLVMASAHLLTVRILMNCSRLLDENLSGLPHETRIWGDYLKNSQTLLGDIAEILDEVAASGGASPNAPPVSFGGGSVGDTVIGLILSKLMAGFDGSETEQERTIREVQSETPEGDLQSNSPETQV